MKKLLMYIMVAIVVVTCGISIYYVVRNDEEISSAIADDSIYYMNVGETLPIPLEYTNPSPHTELSYTVQSEFDIVVDLEAWTITANEAGIVTINFASTNENYASFNVSCYVGNGTSQTPWYVRDAQDLKKIGGDSWMLSDCYQLVSDIDVGGEMLPVGVTIANGRASVSAFTGTFSGGNNGYTIKNAQISQQGHEYDIAVGGLFAMIGSTGKVENVAFDNISVSGAYNYAGVVAGVNYGLIGKCVVTNSQVSNTQTESAFTGGICGLNKHEAGSSNYAQINMCTSDVAITSKWVAGGAAGYNDGGVIFNSLIRTRSLDLSVVGADATYSYFGGIAGISNCDVVDGEAYDSYVANCLAYIGGVRTTSSQVRGVFGAYYGISDVYNARGNYNMILYIAEGNLQPYYLHYDAPRISNDDPSQSRYYVNQISQEEITNASTFTSNSGSTWSVSTEPDSGAVWLIMSNQISINTAAEYQQIPLNGETFEITTASELRAAFDEIRLNPSSNATYIVTEQITLRNEEWTPIGSKENPFMGQILTDEGGLIILRDVTISSSDPYVGLFAYTAGNNTIIEGFYVYGITVEGGLVTGGFVGFNDGATIRNCNIINLTLTGEKYLGGFAGYNSGTIQNCNVNMLYESPYDLYVLDGETYTMLADPSVIIDADGNPIFVANHYNVYSGTVYILESDEGEYGLDSMAGLVASVATAAQEGEDAAAPEQEETQPEQEETQPGQEETQPEQGIEQEGEGNPGETTDPENGDNSGENTDQGGEVEPEPEEPVYVPIEISDLFAELETITQKLIGTIGDINIAENNSSIMYVGGYVGKNVGAISDGFASTISISVPAAATSDMLYVGGAVGLNLGKVKNIWVDENLNINAASYSGAAYAGGIAGYQAGDGSSIESSVVGDSANLITFRRENQNVLAGGIAGFIGAGTTVKYSSAHVLAINAETAGGFAAIINGIVEESYINQSVNLNAGYAGGFACTLNGRVVNSMSAASLSGDTIQAGMVVYLRYGSQIDRCYIDVSFAGGGLTYAETSSAFRLSSEKFGTITNSIIVGSANTPSSSQGSGVGVSDILEMFPIYLQYGNVNGKLAPYITVNGTNAEMQAYFMWWWKGFSGEATDGILASSSEVSGNGMALSNAGFDGQIWNIGGNIINSDENCYVLPTNAAGYPAPARIVTSDGQGEQSSPNQDPPSEEQPVEGQNPDDQTTPVEPTQPEQGDETEQETGGNADSISKQQTVFEQAATKRKAL